MATVTDSLDVLIANIGAARRGDKRLMVALAGPPAAGKSTLAEALSARLDASVVVPMDGFHLDNAVLDARGLRAVKGAPQTFDVAGLAVMIERLSADEADVHIPVFDRGADLARAAAATVERRHRVVLVEGNYLLLEDAPWDALAARFDLTILIEVDEAERERRLVQRWLDHGLDADGARTRAEANDLPNGRRVVDGSVEPDIRYRR